MRSNLLPAPARDAEHSDLVERQLRRYCPRFQGAVRALAMRHARIADLAASFPALLFALAVPRRGLDPALALARAIEGAALAEVAASAEVPLWLRRLPPEMFAGSIMTLPDSELFRRQIANHLPRSPKLAPIWLRAVAEVADLADEAVAVWIARELVRDVKRVKLDRLRLISLWAWFSGRPDALAHTMIERPWMPAMGIGSSLLAAEDWLMKIVLHVNLGREPIADMWLQPARVGDYEFVPLASPAAIAEEAAAMKNCLCSYGYNLAHNRSRIWSVRKRGQRVATLSVARRHRDPLPNIIELRAAANAEASAELWWVARRWLHMHDLPQIDMKRRDWGTVPLVRDAWISIWRPYWLAKRRIPAWLPMAPSRRALGAL
jgi:hypothetical protein